MPDAREPWILAVEPDPGRAANLAALVRDWVAAEVVTVPTADRALEALHGAVPDLILVSTLMPAADDARLGASMRELPGRWTVPTLTVPPVVAQDQPAPRRRVLPFLRRGSAPWPAFDRAAVGRRIRDAFDESRRAGASGLVHAAAAEGPTQAPLVDTALEPGRVIDGAALAFGGLGLKQLREHRWNRRDLPGLSRVRLSWGVDADLVNLSRSGLLLESGSRLSVGELAALELLVGTHRMPVSGRIVRSRVAAGDVGARYQTAVRFEVPIDLPAWSTADAWRDGVGSAAPEIEALLDYVRSEAERGTAPDLVRAAFELGVQALVTAREVRLVSPADVGGAEGGRTVRVRVPALGGPVTLLQAVFDEDREAGQEYALLEAAAARAADVLAAEDRSRGLRPM